jgi:hypothetical protein
MVFSNPSEDLRPHLSKREKRGKREKPGVRAALERL